MYSPPLSDPDPSDQMSTQRNSCEDPDFSTLEDSSLSYSSTNIKVRYFGNAQAHSF